MIYKIITTTPQSKIWVFQNIYFKTLLNTHYIDIGECYPRWLSGKESACRAGDADSFPESEDPLEEGMATHSSILAWRIPWTEEPGRLQSTGS